MSYVRVRVAGFDAYVLRHADVDGRGESPVSVVLWVVAVVQKPVTTKASYACSSCKFS